MVLLPCSLLFCAGNVEAASNIITVNTPNDTSTAGDGSCSLREAINNANSPGTDTTLLDCNKGTGTDIINFTNIPTTSGSGTAPILSAITVSTSLPTIAHNLTIDGIGALNLNVYTLNYTQCWEIQGCETQVPLQVASTGTLYFTHLAVSALNNNGGMVTISNAAVGNDYGVDNNSGGTMTIANAVLANVVNSATLTITNASFNNLQNSGLANVTNSTFGGIYNDGTLAVTNSTSTPGGVAGGAGRHGSWAIFNHSGSATFRNSLLQSSGVECGGNPIVNGGYNISDDGSCGFGTSTGASGQTIGDNITQLLIGDTGYNGGPVINYDTVSLVTIALLPGSPAIAAIPANLCPAADERGEPRLTVPPTPCDIGSFELQPPATITVNTTDDPGTSTECSLRAAINNATNQTADSNSNCAAGAIDYNTIVFNLIGQSQITLSSPLPTIVRPLSIDGSGHTITIDGANLYQIFVNVSNLSLANLTLSDGSNPGGNGGAIDNTDGGYLRVANCTFADNTVTPGGLGGAISNDNASNSGPSAAEVTNSTFSGNTAGQGSAIWNDVSLSISNSTFSENKNVSDNFVSRMIDGDSPIYITNSILAKNAAVTDGTGGNCGWGYVIGDHNISDDATCGFGVSTGANNQPIGDGVDPKLDPNGLQNNGGPTQTIALQPTSPAIGAIPAGSANCPGTDQRGESRPAAGQTGCDVGAFELQGVTPAGTNVTAVASSTTNLTFTNVSTAGVTTATASSTGPTQPTGFYFGNPATYVDVATTATFSGNITVCNSYDPGQYTDPANLSLMHFDGGAWVDVTTSNDTVNHIICGLVTSLSPFTVAQKAVCNTTYSGTVSGNLKVTSGSTCIKGGTVTGNVTQTGGRLLASAATIGGNLQILGGDFSIGSGTAINGNLQVSNLSASKLQYQVCSTKVNGNLQLQSNAAVIAIGGSNCAGATVGGNIQVQNNSATTAISRSSAKRNILVMNNTGMTSLTGDTAGGNIEVQNNANVTQVMSNTAGGNLDCTGNNASMVEGPNTANKFLGQCF